MSHIKLLTPALLLVLALFVTSCGSKEYEYAGNKDVKIERIDKREIEDGFYEISIVFRNSSRSDLNHPKYRVHWFDENGFLLEETSWRPLRIKGGAAVYARERSTRPGVINFKVVIFNED